MGNEDLYLSAAIAGGAFAVINALIRIVEKLIARRNGNNRPMFSEADKTALHNLTGMAGKFEQSHVRLAEDMRDLIRSQNEMVRMFTEFLAKFAEHMEQFKCLKIRD